MSGPITYTSAEEAPIDRRVWCPVLKTTYEYDDETGQWAPASHDDPQDSYSWVKLAGNYGPVEDVGAAEF